MNSPKINRFRKCLIQFFIQRGGIFALTRFKSSERIFGTLNFEGFEIYVAKSSKNLAEGEASGRDFISTIFLPPPPLPLPLPLSLVVPFQPQMLYSQCVRGKNLNIARVTVWAKACSHPYVNKQASFVSAYDASRGPTPIATIVVKTVPCK